MNKKCFYKANRFLYESLLQYKKPIKKKPYYIIKFPVYSKNQVFSFETQGKVKSERKNKTIVCSTTISDQRISFSIDKQSVAVFVR